MFWEFISVLWLDVAACGNEAQQTSWSYKRLHKREVQVNVFVTSVTTLNPEMEKGILDKYFKPNCVARDDILSNLLCFEQKMFQFFCWCWNIIWDMSHYFKLKYFNCVADVEILSGKSVAVRPVGEWSGWTKLVFSLTTQNI